MPNFFNCLKKCIRCCPFLTIDAVLFPQLRSLEIVDPRNLNDSTCFTTVRVINQELAHRVSMFSKINCHFTSFGNIQCKIILPTPINHPLDVLPVCSFIRILDAAYQCGIIRTFNQMDGLVPGDTVICK